MKGTREKFEVTAGVRAENTRQGYLLDYPLENADPAGEQNYTDILPSIHLKYNVHKNANLRLSYGRSINRPGFFEIVPYTILNEDYDEKGNPDLMIPWYTVCGNHEYRGNTQAPVDYSKISARWNMPSKYYTFVKEEDGVTVRIVMVDTCPMIDKYREDTDKSESERTDLQKRLDKDGNVLHTVTRTR